MFSVVSSDCHSLPLAKQFAQPAFNSKSSLLSFDMATTRPTTWFFQREPVKFRLKQLLTFKKKKRGGKRLGFVGC